MQGKYLRSAGVASRRIAGRLFLVTPDEGRVTLLNEVGSRVWDLLDGDHSTADIVTAITREFETGPETARTDVESFLTTLETRGLVRSPEGA